MSIKPEFLIISGNGRNTGKTSFAERVIRKNSAVHNITAIKVSPHFHPANAGINILYANSNFNISMETDMEGVKDSSRMLRAGAAMVYYIEAEDEHLAEAMRVLTEKVKLAGPMICESGGMRKLIEPSLFIVLTRPGLKAETESFRILSPQADLIVHFSDGTFDPDPDNVVFTQNQWEIIEP